MTRLLLGVILFLAGCSAPIAALSPTPGPLPTAAQAPAALITQTPMPLRTSNAALLRIYPLKRNAQWVYRAEEYDTLPNDFRPEMTTRQITATLLITDTVEEIQTFHTYYAAKVVRRESIVSTAMDLNLLGPNKEFYFMGSSPSIEWFILAGDKIYVQNERLNPAEIESGRLEYIFPLTINERWYPDPDQRAQFTPDDPHDIPGYRVVLPLAPQAVPTGTAARCFEIRERYNPGDSIEYFCEGIGVVGEHFDHAGTPFGSHSKLERFTPGQ